MFCYYWGNAAEGDTGCFAAISHQMRQGGVLYRDVFDNKGPGIFYTHVFFQWLTEPLPGNFLYNNYTSALQLFFFVLFYASFAAFSVFKIAKSNNPIIIAVLIILINLGIINTMANWAAFFVGGFTEEIGSYLIFGSIFLLFTPVKKASLFAGFFLGFSFLIKEPFILFLPAFYPFFIKFNRQEKLQMLLGMAFPWLFQVGYLTFTGSWCDYLNYLSFAATYANGNPLTLVQKLALGIENSGIFTLRNGIAFLAVLLGIGLSNIQIKDKLKWLIVPGFIVIIGFVFNVLGTQHYHHYNIPLLLAIALAPILILSAFQKENTKFALKLGLIALIVTANHIVTIVQKQSHWQNSYPAFSKTEQEIHSIRPWIEKLNKQSVYIDEQSSGRMYLYFQSTYKTTYPCPYYTYFLSQDNPNNSPKIAEANQQIAKHQITFAKEFKQQPPQFLITLKNLSPAFWYQGLDDFVNQKFQLIDSFNLAQKTYFIRTIR